VGIGVRDPCLSEDMKSSGGMSDILVVGSLGMAWGAVTGAQYPDLKFIALGFFLTWGLYCFTRMKLLSTSRVLVLCFLAGLTLVSWSDHLIKHSAPLSGEHQNLQVQKMTSGTRNFYARILSPEPYRGLLIRTRTSEDVHARSGAVLVLSEIWTKSEYFYGRWFVSGIAQRAKPLPAESLQSFGTKIHKNWNDFRLLVQRKAVEMCEGFPLVTQFLLEAVLGVKGENFSLEKSLKPLGLGHIFTISGFHLSLWGLLCIFFLKRITSRFGFQWLGYLAALLLYALIVECKPSVFRALVFGILLFSGRELTRSINPFRLLALTFWVHLLFFPADSLTPAFVLTYGITFYLLIAARFSGDGLLRKLLWLCGLHLMLAPYFLGMFGEYPLGSLVGIFLASILGVSIGFLMISLVISLGISELVIFLRPCFQGLEFMLEGLSRIAAVFDYKLLMNREIPSEFLILFYFFIFIFGWFKWRDFDGKNQEDSWELEQIRRFCPEMIHFPRERFEKEFLYFLEVITKNKGCQQSGDCELLFRVLQIWLPHLRSTEIYPFLHGPFSMFWDREMKRIDRMVDEYSALDRTNSNSLVLSYQSLKKAGNQLLLGYKLPQESFDWKRIFSALIFRRHCNSLLSDLQKMNAKLNSMYET